MPNTEVESLGSVGWNRITLYLHKSFSELKKTLNSRMSEFESGRRRAKMSKDNNKFGMFANAAWNTQERTIYRETEKYLEKLDWALMVAFRFTERIISVGFYNRMVA